MKVFISDLSIKGKRIRGSVEPIRLIFVVYGAYGVEFVTALAAVDMAVAVVEIGAYVYADGEGEGEHLRQTVGKGEWVQKYEVRMTCSEKDDKTGHKMNHNMDQRTYRNIGCYRGKTENEIDNNRGQVLRKPHIPQSLIIR